MKIESGNKVKKKSPDSLIQRCADYRSGGIEIVVRVENQLFCSFSCAEHFKALPLNWRPEDITVFSRPKA